MERARILIAILIVTVAGASLAAAADRGSYDRLVLDMDAARQMEADIFAPKTWEKVIDAWADAKKDLDRGKKQADVDKHVAEAAEYTANAVKAAEIGKLSLQDYLDPRNRAREAEAPRLVTELYLEAEEVFLKATRNVEEGDVNDGLKEAAKARSLFAGAELEAIRITILGKADQLIAKAEAAEAEDFAPSTLDKARSARSKSNIILTSDRYNRDEAVDLAMLAEYEARHASNIGQSVRSLERNDQAWEKLMLGYEIQMNRVGQAGDMGYLPFDNGSKAAANELIAKMNELQAQNMNLNGQLDIVAASLERYLNNAGQKVATESPVEMASQIERSIEAIKLDRHALSMQIERGQASMAELEVKQQAAQKELMARRERENRFRKAKSLLNPSEGEVLYNPANDVVLRLHGLSFRPGSSDIVDGHMGLLTKVQKVVEMYPNAQLVIEGHTDSVGDPGSNLALSQNRSYSVMMYLREAMLLSSNRVQAVGYGAEHPVGSNQSSDGRAKNRRIDIVIMQ